MVLKTHTFPERFLYIIYNRQSNEKDKAIIHTISVFSTLGVHLAVKRKSGYGIFITKHGVILT